MDANYLLIPKKIKVGFQERNDTYTKKLAYITYIDNKGKLRKETSWEGWRSHQIPVEEYDNIPTSGFVLNKNVGGYKSDWNFRKSYIRVYDSRGFEFEISLENLLMILENCICTPGKGLEGEFVYSWSGTELVLLPLKAPDYQKALQYNQKLEKVGAFSYKDLKAGCTYITKKNKELVFLGEYDWYEEKYTNNYKDKELKKSNRYIFAAKDDDLEDYYAMARITVCNSIVGLVSEEIPEAFDIMLEQIQHSQHISPVDYENVKLRDMTFEEFEQMVDSHNTILFYVDETLMLANIKIDSIYMPLSVSKENKCICYYEKYTPGDFYCDGNNKRYFAFKNLEDCYNKINPKIGTLYLQNGHKYLDFFENEYHSVYFF